MDITLLTPNYIPPIYVTMDIFSADVPALLRLDILDMYSFVPDTVINFLKKGKITKSDRGKFKEVLEEWSVPLSLYEGHIYAAMNLATTTFFARPQL